jgi:hypothetical protein
MAEEFRDQLQAYFQQLEAGENDPGMGRISILEGAVVALATFVVVAQAESLEEEDPWRRPLESLKLREPSVRTGTLRLEQAGRRASARGAVPLRWAPRALNPPLGLIRIAAPRNARCRRARGQSLR